MSKVYMLEVSYLKKTLPCSLNQIKQWLESFQKKFHFSPPRFPFWILLFIHIIIYSIYIYKFGYEIIFSPPLNTLARQTHHARSQICRHWPSGQPSNRINCSLVMDASLRNRPTIGPWPELCPKVGSVMNFILINRNGWRVKMSERVGCHLVFRESSLDDYFRVSIN